MRGQVTIRFLRCAILAALAIGAAVFARPACAGAMNEVSCSSIALKYTGEARETKCLYYDDVGNQTEVVVQRIIVKLGTSELIVSHTASKFRTYLPIQPLRSTVNGQYFSDTDNWQPEAKYAGFDIAAFNGYEKSGSQPVLCAAFSRYSGNPGNYEFDGGVGYKNEAEGIYCAFSGQAALINPIDNFYRVVEDALSKVQFPPDQ
jgi:hypothetical protein